MPIPHESSFIQYKRIAQDMQSMTDQASGGFDLLKTFHNDHYQSQAYDNLMESIRVYAAGGFTAKNKPSHSRDIERMIAHTKVLGDGFAFGLAVADRLAPLTDPDHDSYLGMTIDLMTRTIFQGHTDRERGIQMLEDFGAYNYHTTLGEESSDPTNSFHWFVTDFALGLYSTGQRDTNMGRFYSGIGLAHYAYAEMQEESDRKLTEIILAENFTVPPL